jgi:hypothetical protein
MLRLASNLIEHQVGRTIEGTDESCRLRDALERDLEVFEANDFRTDARRVRRVLGRDR